MTIAYGDFQRVDIRVGRIDRVEPFPEARRPAWKLWIDFGPELGVRRTSAQLTANYAEHELTGRLVVAVVNFAPKQIASFMSEVLVLGVPDAAGEVVLLGPDRDVPLGGRMY
jgi:tRNA-binding protein